MAFLKSQPQVPQKIKNRTTINAWMDKENAV
jgi:hypothetical protein